MRKISVLVIIFLLISCSNNKKIGKIEVWDKALNEIIDTTATADVLAEGFTWSEGPLWLEKENKLIFSDVPNNIIWSWNENEGLQKYLQPSGYTITEQGNGNEGANGLLLNARNQLVLCQHGDRRIAIMQSDLQNPTANFKTIINNWQGKRLNSPNDAVYDEKENLYFTDPPYGLKNDDQDSLKEIPFSGLFLYTKTDSLKLLSTQFTRPNGLALFPGDSLLLIANSDANQAFWKLLSIRNDSIVKEKIWFDATTKTSTEPGLPDGLKINSKGIVFATGPGGVWIFNKDGKVLGRILLPVPAANCALHANEKYLYITAEKYLLGIQLK
ncbi:MAG: SMP-30/gluconolactonase/LRE family protein [Cyclobacteriaceae bacterium]|jgi:gluconolactonase|nr:SMP-30/gluconolactonase/LRE family protein [Cyclobacteriaceae bacterium]